MDNIAIMTSGGDAAGMNPALKFAVEYANRKGLKAFIIRNGLRGLIDNEISEATRSDVSGILHRGGTIIRSSRSKRFFEDKYRKQAYDNLQKLGINKLIVIGGDGSFTALKRFYDEYNIPFAGIPATIDNDIPGTDYCLGVDTALNVIREAIDSIRDTALSFSRAFVIETMGLHCGYLAMASALSSGAEICLAPELDYDLESIGRRLKKDIASGRRYLIAVVAEGCNMGAELTQWIRDELGMDARLTILGHVQRGGSPTVRDRVMAYNFAVQAVDSLLAGKTNQVMTFKEGHYGSSDIDVIQEEVKMDPYILELAGYLAV